MLVTLFQDPSPIFLSPKRVNSRKNENSFKPHCQQLLNRVWYGEFAYFRCIPGILKFSLAFFLGLMWPVWSLSYIFLPRTDIGRVINTPIFQYVCATASYVTFLIMLSLWMVSKYGFVTNICVSPTFSSPKVIKELRNHKVLLFIRIQIDQDLILSCSIMVLLFGYSACYGMMSRHGSRLLWRQQVLKSVEFL